MKISTLILTILVCFSTIVDAQGTQNRANELMKQAQSSLEQKEYTKARYLFIQAYGAFATQENYPKAVECGIQEQLCTIVKIITKRHSTSVEEWIS